MKHLLTLLAAMASTALLANNIHVSPTGLLGDYMIVAQSMSVNGRYVVGLDEIGLVPVYWDTQTDEVYWVETSETYTLKDAETGELVEVTEQLSGSFQGVSNNGTAVGTIGAEGTGFAILARIVNGDIQFTRLRTTGEFSTAMAITNNGDIIAGYHGSGITIKACIWKQNGAQCIDLPEPTKEEFGDKNDGTKALWISADGSRIGGYAIEWSTGKNRLILWDKQADGSYRINYAARKDYLVFEPTAMSSNGEWIALQVKKDYDDDVHAARYCPTAGRLEILDFSFGEGEAPLPPEFCSIANQGAAVGYRGRGEEDAKCSYLWAANQQTAVTLSELCPDETYFQHAAGQAEEALMYISYDAKQALGWKHDLGTSGTDWITTSFILNLPVEFTPVNNIETKKSAAKQIVDGQLIIIRDGKHFSVLGHRK